MTARKPARRARTQSSAGTPSGLNAIGIGERNEKSLHAALKRWYARKGDRFEVRVDGFVVDIVRGALLIEIQTRNLSAIRRKLATLLENHPVRLVHPIAKVKWIVRTNRSGNKVIGRRKSPKVGRPADLFDELVSIPDLVSRANFSIQILMIEEEEVRRVDGRGSWRRRGQSIQDRKLLAVVETIDLETNEDFLRFLPGDLEQPFSNASLAERTGDSVHDIRRMTHCLRKMGAIEAVDKKGNQLLFRVVTRREP